MSAESTGEPFDTVHMYEITDDTISGGSISGYWTLVDDGMTTPIARMQHSAVFNEAAVATLSFSESELDAAVIQAVGKDLKTRCGEVVSNGCDQIFGL